MIERQCQGLVEIHRAEAHARFGRRPRRGQEALAARRQMDQRGPARIGADGLSDLRPGRHRQIVSGRVLRRLDRHSVPRAAQLPLEVCGRNGRQPGASARRAAVARAGGGDRRRGRRGARQPAGVGRFGHVGPRVFDDRQPDGRHALSRADHLDAAHQPARFAADRPQAARPCRSAHPAVLSAQRGRHSARCCA